MTVTLTVNGSRAEVQAASDAMLLDVLRDQLGLLGARGACGVGLCGACTVLLDGAPVSSCILFAHQAQDRDITTVEGLEEDDTVVRAFAACHAFQCGYCTPGMVLTAKAFLAERPRPDRAEIVEALGGNLCRCGCYVKIVDAIEEAARCAT
jgi:aerobic-type carbon monoxide dehydrogenase small subunit (CoxS/CutS family)